MNQALLLSAVLMGLAGTPHCLAMCGAACTAASGGGQPAPLAMLHLGRLLSYAAAGAVAAASVGALAALGQAVSVLRPLWTLVHAAALVLGLYLLWQGRQPAWLERLGRRRATVHTVQVSGAGAWRTLGPPLRSGGLGLAWAAWPCGLLQSALLVAALANTPVQGAVVMVAFGTASALGLVAGPVVWRRLSGGAASGAAVAGSVVSATSAVSATWAVRLAGLALAGASAWAMGHGVWQQVAAWCFG